VGFILGDRKGEKLPVFVTIRLYVNINDAVTELDFDSDSILETEGLELNDALELGSAEPEKEGLALTLAETLVEPLELTEALVEPVELAEPESTLEDEGVKEFVTVCPKALVVFDAEGVCVALLDKDPFTVFVESNEPHALGVWVSI
jgi:hypothetical protein